jgi:hypothetical protein
MDSYRPPRNLAILAASALALSCAIAGPASADLPRTYTVQRIDNPTPDLNERFGDGFVNGGDVNGDGEDDILVGIDEHATIEGEVFVFSGADGALIRRIPPPDPDAVNGSSAGNPDNPAAFGTFVGKIADMGSCPGFSGQAGDDCTAAQGAMDTGDGVPDHLASAIGVDIADAAGDDMGMAYVIDGATGAVLKRMRVPPGDRDEQAANSPTASQGPGFGRTILSPSGQPPCPGFGGRDDQDAAPCAYLPNTFVARGDVDGGGRPDIGVGASDFTDKGGGASSPASENPVCSTTCFQTGRYYVYRGEALVGRAPDEPLEDSYYTIKNPMAQNDTADINSRFHREALGYSVAPVGDLGRCTNTAPITDTDDPSAYFCLNAANNPAPDGKPEFILSAHRTDWNGMGDVGVAFAIDGATGRILDIYRPPQPQQAAIFAFSNYNQPAMGDLGSTLGVPDVYQGAMVHQVDYLAEGRGWVLTGDFRGGGANHYSFATLEDPTPSHIGNFSTSSAGLGDVEGDPRNELMVGAYGPHAPQVVDDVISDVHIFSALGERVLQTIPDPDQDPGGGFGRALAPLGDLNDDGFLDFAVGAGGYDGGGSVSCSPCNPTTPGAPQGRVYILRSDNSPAPPAGGGSGGGPSAAAPLAGRSLELAASRARIRRRRRVTLRGALEAFSNSRACVPGQRVAIQRRRPGSARYRTFAQRTTNANGGFRVRTRPRRTYFYRARVGQTEECHGAVSNREKVGVRRRRR